MTKRRKRGNGEGTIYQGKDGYWRGQITTGYGDKGNQRRKTFSGSTRSEVAEKMKVFQYQQQKGILTDNSKMTLGQYIDHWLGMKKKDLKITTFEGYVQLCDLYIKPELGNVRIQKLTAVQLNTFFSNRREHLSSATVRKIRAIMNNILSQAVRENLLVVNIVNNCNPIKGKSPEMVTLNESQTKELLAKARELFEQQGDKFKFLYHAVLLGLATGMRRGEVLALKWESIDFEEKTITVKENLVEVKGGVRFDTPKSKASGRTIHVSSEVLESLLELKKGVEGLVFRTKNNTPITPSNLARAFRALVKILNMEGVSFHSLRHTHATLLLAKALI